MLRLARETDQKIWIKLNREFMEFEIQDNNLWNHIDKAKDDDLAEVFDEALENPDHITIFMIENEDKIIGFANLLKIFSVWSEGFSLVIDDLYITDEYRGRGYGRATMQEIENYARRNSFRRVQFQSEKTNPEAKAFYTKIGYRPAEMSFYVRYL